MTRALAACSLSDNGTVCEATAATLDSGGTPAFQNTSCLVGAITATPAGVTDGVSDSIANINASIKVVEPTVAVTGTVVFFTGGNGASWWENQYPNSVAPVLEAALARGQRVIQVNWTGGWTTGAEGPLALAARGATLLREIYDDTTLHDYGTPFCVVGHSAGGSLLAYALCHYGAHEFIDLAVFTAGPPHSRIDYGVFGTGHPGWAAIGPALCTTGSTIDYSASENSIIDASYTTRTYAASNVGAGGIDNPLNRDSILRVDACLDWPHTDVTFVFGDGDNTVACPLGRHFARQLVGAYTENITTGGIVHASVPDSVSGTGFINAALAAARFRH